MRLKLTLSLVATVVAVVVATVLGFFVYRGMQPEVFALLPWGSEQNPTTQAEGQSMLQDAISQGLDANAVMATKKQLQDALNSGCSFCAYGWCASDKQNIYSLNTMSSGNDCGPKSNQLQYTSPQGFGSIAVFVYGKKPSPSSALSYATLGSSAGVMPWQWGTFNGTGKWSQYSPRITL